MGVVKHTSRRRSLLQQLHSCSLMGKTCSMEGTGGEGQIDDGGQGP